MDTLVERCAGLDIGKADLKACVRTPGKNARRVREIRTFATTTVGLLQLRDWLTGHQVTVVGMEATGDYWKPSLSRFPCKPRVTNTVNLSQGEPSWEEDDQRVQRCFPAVGSSSRFPSSLAGDVAQPEVE